MSPSVADLAFLSDCQTSALLDRDGADAQERAVETFERALASGNDLGMLSEMFDLDTGEATGNVPQALSHVGLIAVANLLRGDRQPDSIAASGGANAAAR